MLNSQLASFIIFSSPRCAVYDDAQASACRLHIIVWLKNETDVFPTRNNLDYHFFKACNRYFNVQLVNSPSLIHVFM